MDGHPPERPAETYPLLPAGVSQSRSRRVKPLRLIVLLACVLVFKNMLLLQRSILLEQKQFVVERNTLQLSKDPPTAAEESRSSRKAGSKDQGAVSHLHSVQSIAQAPSQRLRVGSRLNYSEPETTTSTVTDSNTSSSQLAGELMSIDKASELTKPMKTDQDSNTNSTHIDQPSRSSLNGSQSNGNESEQPKTIDLQNADRQSTSKRLNDRTRFTTNLYKTTQQQPRESRGIVLPLFNHIAALGMSLILELRAMGVDLPIEIPHCGDLSHTFRRMIYNRDPMVRIYDVCRTAVESKTETGEPLFCRNISHCHQKFRGFDIKIISVVLSQFQEVMLMDADTLYFQSPMLLWDSQQYNTTGTFFFYDRIGQDHTFLSKMVRNSTPEMTQLEDFLSQFDVKPFRHLPTLNRTIASTGPAAEARAKPTIVPLSFEPSDVLLTSHSWNRRSGHEMDSSLLLWDKTRQPRATTILASFVSMVSRKHPPGYGDKELFFLACELAETDYAFSNIGVGSIGVNYRVYNERSGKKSAVLCGDAVQFLPTGADGQTAVESALPLYFNGDSALAMKSGKQQILRTEPRAADFYNGSNRERGIPLACLMDMKVLRAKPQELKRISRRQRLHEIVVNWLDQKGGAIVVPRIETHALKNTTAVHAPAPKPVSER